MSLKEKYSSSNPAQKCRPGLSFVYSHPSHLLALFFGAGCLRPGPGTWGSLAGAAVWIALVTAGLPWPVLAGCIVLVSVLGAWASDRTMKDLGVADPGCIVIDEVAGVWLVMLCFPQTWAGWLASFVAFRICDIVKMPGASWVDDHWHSGWGVIADDLLAALWAVAALLLTERMLLLADISLFGWS